MITGTSVKRGPSREEVTYLQAKSKRFDRCLEIQAAPELKCGGRITGPVVKKAGREGGREPGAGTEAGEPHAHADKRRNHRLGRERRSDRRCEKHGRHGCDVLPHKSLAKAGKKWGKDCGARTQAARRNY